MKKIMLLFAISFIANWTYGQGQMDALKLSGTDLSGSARGVAMGGAFGALGGDITGVKQNPAGIGVYRSSEIVGTLDFSSVNTKTNTLGTTVKDSKFNFALDNLAYMGYMPLTGDVKSFHFGIAYNRLKNFNRNYQARGNALTSSLTDYIAEFTTQRVNVDAERFEADDSYDNFPWISVLGYNGGLINDNGNGYIGPLVEFEDGTLQTVDRLYSVSERGHIDSYDFTMGTNILDMLYLGLTFSFTDIRYNLDSRHTEEFEEGQQFEGGGGGGFDLDNRLRTEGGGYQVSLGAIYRPIDELRIGVAYHSPTWYNLTDYYFAQTDYEGWLLEWKDGMSEWVWDGVRANTPSNAFTDYTLRTPDRWVMSIAGVLGGKALLSVDYEYTDYSKMRLGSSDGFNNAYIDQNNFISQDFVGASTLKAGLEYRVTPQLALRAGYSWAQSPLEKSFKNGDYEVFPVGTVTAYTLDGDTNHYSFGVGYRFTPEFYMDFAMSRNQKSQLYTYSPIVTDDGIKILDSEPAELKTNSVKGLLTLGYRF